jgi:hypothetical protein
MLFCAELLPHLHDPYLLQSVVIDHGFHLGLRPTVTLLHLRHIYQLCLWRSKLLIDGMTLH